MSILLRASSRACGSMPAAAPVALNSQKHSNLGSSNLRSFREFGVVSLANFVPDSPKNMRAGQSRALFKSSQQVSSYVTGQSRPPFFSPNVRSLSTQTSNVFSGKTLVVLGATAQMGPLFILEGIQRGYSQVLAVSRRKIEGAEGGHLKWIEFKGTEIADSHFWNKVFEDHCGVGSIHVINLIGAAVVPKGSSGKLEDINAKPVLASLQALEEQQNMGREVGIVNLSSICASIFPEKIEEQGAFCEQSREYCSLRQRVDRVITDSSVPSIVIRPGFIFKDLIMENIIDSGHPYSPEQFSRLPLHPVLGSGTQIQQPVHWGDVIDAAMNGLELRESHILDAVGPDVMTQAEMFEFFTRLVGKKFRKIQIPYDLALAIAKYAPKGRIAPYSVGAFRHLEREDLKKPLDKHDFESIIGRPLISMNSLYNHLDQQTIVISNPPVVEHVREILNAFRHDEGAFKEISCMLIKYGPELCYQAIRAFLS